MQFLSKTLIKMMLILPIVAGAQTWQSVGGGAAPAPVTNATAGAVCTPSRSIGLDQWNRSYTCVESKWRMEYGGTRDEYTFTITGQTPRLMRGFGTVNTSNNTFTGDLMCDPYTFSIVCGSAYPGVREWCGADASCAYIKADFYTHAITPSHTHTTYGVVGVTALPIQNITTIR